MNIPLTSVFILLAAYFCGSIPFGLLLGKLFGAKDVRKTGSGNIGATNVARSAGLSAGILTLLLDASKGAIPVWLARHYFPEQAAFQILAGLGALAGHCFPAWLKFRGGKGVATAAGAFLVLCPPAAVGALLIFVLVVGFWRYVSLASISAAAAMPLLVYFLWAPHFAPPISVTAGSLAAALLIIYKHDANMQRLVEGTEPKFSLGKEKDAE
ncbi:MAG TPA: glycerol-3-phosphate 1-O-acyltransferase PlsY [Candidatus Sulfotelmatobacter sp.]|jgi:glycerol-3-phosphate acyltransferase PlsY|nr:glycerol-3-phosphate 1-O-acyltransferase PlsY [Candidatus Sulfotelmatobacter sp.]